MKNTCAKTVKRESAYEVWTNGQGWTWYVVKKYQAPDKEAANPYARWHCIVTSPYTGERGEYGDVYVRDVKSGSYKVEQETAVAKAA